MSSLWPRSRPTTVNQPALRRQLVRTGSHFANFVRAPCSLCTRPHQAPGGNVSIQLDLAAQVESVWGSA